MSTPAPQSTSTPPTDTSESDSRPTGSGTAPAPVATPRWRQTRMRLVAAGAALVLLVAGVAGARAAGRLGFGSGTGAAGVSADPGWSLLWGDGFGGSGRLSKDWVYRTGNAVPGGPAAYGTDEVETNSDSTAHVAQSGGALHITATRDGSGRWTSGRVESARQDLRPPQGGVLAVEGRMQLPDVSGAAGQGYWPAFWLLGAPFRSNPWSWPGVGEIDIMENVQGLNTVFGTVHCGTAPGGECHEKDGLSGKTTGGTPSLQKGMHTYRVEWDESVTPHQIRWYVDGKPYYQVTSAQMSPQTWANAFGHGFYLILDLAMGGQFPAAFGGGPTPQTASGGSLVVDYVKAETRGGTPRS